MPKKRKEPSPGRDLAPAVETVSGDGALPASIPAIPTSPASQLTPAPAETTRPPWVPVAVTAITQVFGFLRVAVTWGGICFASWMGYLAISVIAGKTTAFQAVMTLFFDMRATEGVALTAAAITGIGWWKDHRRNGLLTQEVSRLTKLEKNADPNRSSSGLTEMGDSPEGDDE